MKNNKRTFVKGSVSLLACITLSGILFLTTACSNTSTLEPTETLEQAENSTSLSSDTEVIPSANSTDEKHESSADSIPTDSSTDSASDGNTLLPFELSDQNLIYNNITYSTLTVDGGNRNGNRQSLVAVDIGFGNRVYWGLTNEYGQLVHVIAEEIILQNDDTEAVNSDGRYYPDEANVPGTEHPDLDQGHIIADSLGGVANAYNITPQDSILNRHGDQAYMEKVIRDAGGCTEFIATITYPDTTTQTPNKYHYEYVLMGNKIIDEFENKNPEGDTVSNSVPNGASETSTTSGIDDIKQVDINNNGQVTIKEAKTAGYSMPITSDHWLYPYMDDRDGDGLVGE